jgi:cytochrome c biogenesis protein CcmG/thiol:disulfide interchange protein DsbE
MTARAQAHTTPDLRRLSRRHLVVAAVVPLILLTALSIWLVARPGPSPTAIGAVAPDFSLIGLDGEPVTLAELRGRPVVVNFWASWCEPCIEEFPLLVEAAERHAADDLAIVGIVYQDRTESARAFMVRSGATWPAAMDPDGAAAAAYGVVGPPETYFIGRDGRIVARQLGQFTEASLTAKLADIMDEE